MFRSLVRAVPRHGIRAAVAVQAPVVARPAVVKSVAAVGVASLAAGMSTTKAAYNPPAPGDLVVLDSPVLTLLFSKIRATETGTRDYVFYMNRLMRYLAEEGVAALPTLKTDVQTPCGVYEGLMGPADEDITIVSIIRAGDSLADAVREIIPGCSVGKILIQRDESDAEKRPILHYSKLGPHIAKHHVLLCDPMVATGGSAAKAIEVIKEKGVKEEDITFLCIVAAPEGIFKLRSKFPKMRIVAAAVDLKLNGDKYIVPGLGDAGDRYFGTNE